MNLETDITGPYIYREAIVADVEAINETLPSGVAYQLRWKFVLRDCRNVADMLTWYYRFTRRAFADRTTLWEQWIALMGTAPPTLGHINLSVFIGSPCLIGLDMGQHDEFGQPLVANVSTSQLPSPYTQQHYLVRERQVRRDDLLRKIFNHPNWVREMREAAAVDITRPLLTTNGERFVSDPWSLFPYPPFEVALDGMLAFVLDLDGIFGDVLTDPRYRLDELTGAPAQTPASGMLSMYDG